MLKTIKVPAGNRFVIYIPATWQDGSPVVEEELTDLQVILRNSAKVIFDATVEVAGSNFVVTPDDLLPLGSYDILISGMQAGREFALPLNNAFAICEWANDANFADTLTLNAVVLVGSAYTDEEIEALKEQYRTAIEAADEAKAAAEVARDEYIAKAEALDDIAQQSTLVQGVTDIRRDIANIDIDTSALATEANATANKEAILNAVSEATVSADSIISLANSWTEMVTKRNSISGWKLYNTAASGIGDIILGVYQKKLEEVVDDSILTYPGNLSIFVNQLNLTSVKFNELQTLDGRGDFFNLNNLQEILLPKCSTISGHGANFIYNNPILKKVYAPNATMCQFTITTSAWNLCPQLIDIELGEVNSNITLNAWSPTEALARGNSSLVDADESFADNLEKLLYNIREHIAAKIADRTGMTALTITFSSAVKAAINADSDTLAAFTNKNWTVA